MYATCASFSKPCKPGWHDDKDNDDEGYGDICTPQNNSGFKAFSNPSHRVWNVSPQVTQGSRRLSSIPQLCSTQLFLHRFSVYNVSLLHPVMHCLPVQFSLNELSLNKLSLKSMQMQTIDMAVITKLPMCSSILASCCFSSTSNTFCFLSVSWSSFFCDSWRRKEKNPSVKRLKRNTVPLQKSFLYQSGPFFCIKYLHQHSFPMDVWSTYRLTIIISIIFQHYFVTKTSTPQQ